MMAPMAKAGMVFRRILKWIGLSLLFFIVFIILFLGVHFVASRITVNKGSGPATGVTIYIKTNGVHTDIVVPVRNETTDWSREVKYAYTHLPDTTYSYLAFGWGDKGFYLNTPQWSDLKFSTAFNAMFGLGSSAMHCTYYAQLPEDKTCHKITITSQQYAQLVAFIRSSFQQDTAGHFRHIITNANYGLSDAFYEANNRYCMFYTCNTWANSALKHAGQKCCLWTIFDTGIFAKYNND